MQRVLAVLLAIASVSIVSPSASWAQRRPLLKCHLLDRCINDCAQTYSQCKSPGPFVTPESVCRKALLQCAPQCHARYGYCSI